MDYFITPDSGLMHIASAVEKLKIIALFGPTDPSLTGPVGKNFTVLRDSLICIPCFKKECPLNKIENNNLTECVLCMKRITPDMVFDIIKRDSEIK
jgi:ADP-heptose:LPS heptosyltransferase